MLAVLFLSTEIFYFKSKGISSFKFNQTRSSVYRSLKLALMDQISSCRKKLETGATNISLLW
jgi:hypothetical protein